MSFWYLLRVLFIILALCLLVLGQNNRVLGNSRNVQDRALRMRCGWLMGRNGTLVRGNWAPALLARETEAFSLTFRWEVPFLPV